MCNMDCKNCTIPVNKCRGGDYSTANIIPHRERIHRAAKPSKPYYHFGCGVSKKPKKLY